MKEVVFHTANNWCAGVTRRFHKTTFRGFSSEREFVDFLHVLWRHFCQILLRTWKRKRFLKERQSKLKRQNEKYFFYLIFEKYYHKSVVVPLDKNEIIFQILS